jgi:hypothetical protein
MTAAYAIALVLGIIAILAWIAAVAVAETVSGWEHIDPDRRFGARGRATIGGLSGLGLAGMSATYGGWHDVAAFVAAVAGAAAVAVVATRLRAFDRAED